MENNSPTTRSEFQKVLITRERFDYFSEFSMDILVDDQSFGVIRSGERIEIPIEKNKPHRIQCIITNNKSNVLFLDINEKTNINISISSQNGKIEIAKFPDIEKLNSHLNSVEKERMDRIVKKKKSLIRFISIISITIVIIMVCSICFERSKTAKSNNDITDFTLSDMTWLLGEDKTFIVISCKITNNSSTKRTYYCAYGLHRQSDDLLIAYGTAYSITISPKSSKDNPAVCDPSDLWVAMGNGKRFKESDLNNTYIKIHSITIDGHKINLNNNYILEI